MQDERSDKSGLAGLELQLAALAPRAQIDRDRLMFEAGARAARRKLLAVNRLLGAACVLLAVTAVAPLAMPKRADVIAHEEPNAKDRTPLAKNIEKAGKRKALPNQLAVADGRELAAAMGEGRSDLRPARLRDITDETIQVGSEHDGSPARATPARLLLREYLGASAERL